MVESQQGTVLKIKISSIMSVYLSSGNISDLEFVAFKSLDLEILILFISFQTDVNGLLILSWSSSTKIVIEVSEEVSTESELIVIIAV